MTPKSIFHGKPSVNYPDVRILLILIDISQFKKLKIRRLDISRLEVGGHPQTTWFSNWDFLTPPPPYVATFQIADVVFSRTFLDPPSPPEVATWFVDDPLRRNSSA